MKKKSKEDYIYLHRVFDDKIEDKKEWIIGNKPIKEVKNGTNTISKKEK